MSRNRLFFGLILIALTVSVILPGCSKVNERHFTLAEIQDIFDQQGVQLVQKGDDAAPNSVFAQASNGVAPSIYTIGNEQQDPSVFIYIYPSMAAASDGVNAFNDKTATADLIANKRYHFANVVLFYIKGDPSYEQDIDQMVSRLRAQRVKRPE
ncbi:hypothetical protein [Paenibacillus sp. OV219]|uniref:hypothetical protein n=1 Tax=Paenibacillus sp. OV219 TaxID=1884377 RepID=UPI0008C96819|nr:hypothetical protein [Paenibacillus sp. OV219]SEO76220.1 hypothetical protein SAMN05518847_110165 [Paenibacillus sp. OV219]